MNLKAIVFDKLPAHDTCWSLTTGADGIIYAAACCEVSGGVGACLISYNPETDQVDYLLDVAELVGDPPDNGRATQGKIHYCLISSEDGILYGATHCTSPPRGDFLWRPWHCWSDHRKSFPGSKLFAYDTKNKEVVFTDLIIPKEGSRCMALDEKRKKLYGVSYPRDHFFIYDIEKRQTKDLGRIGSVNPQCIFLDGDGNAYTTDDYGYIIRCDAEKEKLYHLDIQLPHAPFRDGFHNVVYDAVPSPDGKSVYGVTWDFNVRMFRYDPEDGPEGKIYDLGRAYGPETTQWWDIKNYHTGGLVFGLDGLLYFVMNLGGADKKPHLIRLDPETGKRENLGIIEDGDIVSDHICRATRDFAGRLYFADVGTRPTKIFRYQPEYKNPLKPGEFKSIRRWG